MGELILRRGNIDSPISLVFISAVVYDLKLNDLLMFQSSFLYFNTPTPNVDLWKPCKQFQESWVWVRADQQQVKMFPLTKQHKLVLASHAVEDEPQEDEGVVAVVRFHIFHHSLTQLAKVAGFRKLALVHEAGPRSNGHPAPVDPLFSRADREAFREPDPVKGATNEWGHREAFGISQTYRGLLLIMNYVINLKLEVSVNAFVCSNCVSVEDGMLQLVCVVDK